MCLSTVQNVSFQTKSEKMACENCVSGVSADERNQMKRKSVKEGESVSLESDETKNPKVMMWYFNDTRIAEITGDQSKICTDDQCKERFRHRLKLDHQTGSLIITNTRTTDSGLYTLQIIISDSRFSISREKRFSVTVTGEYTIQSFMHLLYEKKKVNILN